MQTIQWRQAARIALIASCFSVSIQAAVVLPDVPSYNWYHGCTPTSAGMLFGYWDLNGYSNLFDAAGADLYSTASVQDQISSPAHNAKYDPNPDNPSLPNPPDTSIADFMHTSEGTGFGWTWFTYMPSGVEGYAAFRGYTFDATEEYWNINLWSDYKAEINAGRPSLINVDSDGDGANDHTMLALGYDDRGAAGLWYASYNTWHESETIDWYRFRPVRSGDGFGVTNIIKVDPISPPDAAAVPEPGSALLCASCVAGLLGLRGRRARNHDGRPGKAARRVGNTTER